jgi:hypothetical protein
VASTTLVSTLTPYESDQVKRISAWKCEPANPISELWNLAVLQVVKPFTKLVPDSLVRGAIEYSYSLAEFLAGPGTLLNRAGVGSIPELRGKSLEECDRLASEVAAIAKVTATLEGALTGLGGMVTTAIDVPLQFATALRTIIRIGYCYGYPADDPNDRFFNLGILTIATAGTLATRVERIEQLRDLERILIEETQVDVIRSELLSFLFQLELFEEIPGIGVISGAFFNFNFMHKIESTARKIFQERWLKDAGKVAEILPAVEIPVSPGAGWSALAGRAMYGAVYTVAFGVTLPAFATADIWGRLSGNR